MNMELQDKFEAYVQKSLSHIDGYTLVWQSIGPSLEILAFLTLVHSEEGSGFTLDDLASEATELGLLSEGNLEEVVALLRRDGLLEGNYVHPLVGAPARRLMDGLNEAYPTMPGIILAAYLIQLLQELLEGRNAIEKAFEQVDQALSLSDKEENITQDDPAETAARRDRLLKRLTDIRRNLVERSGRQIQVKEILPFEPKATVKTLVVSDEDESAETDTPFEPSVSEISTQGTVQPDVPDREAAQREAFLALQREKMQLEREREILRLEKKRLEAERESQVVWKTPDESLDTSRDALTSGDSDEEIAAAIARFEESLSLVCPICGKGVLDTHETDTGKTFYRCDDRSCGFVTWKRPYPFCCPVCKNSFLVVNNSGDGLICPKSVCTYSQNGFEVPLERPSTAVPGSPSKKVRKVRRVIRRKRR